MVHKLSQPGEPLHAAGMNPLTATLRYRCKCAKNEVLTISVVMDMHLSEDAFIWTMRRLWQDMHIEIVQHTEQGK